MVEGGTLDRTVLCCCFCDPGLAFSSLGRSTGRGQILVAEGGETFGKSRGSFVRLGLGRLLLERDLDTC